MPLPGTPTSHKSSAIKDRLNRKISEGEKAISQSFNNNHANLHNTGKSPSLPEVPGATSSDSALIRRMKST